MVDDQRSRLRLSRAVSITAVAAVFLVAVSLTGAPPVRADHGDTGLEFLQERALAVAVDGDPVDEVIEAPVVPRECWTTQHFPYTIEAHRDNFEACVTPWESVHRGYSFQGEAGGTYLVWYQIFDIHTPSQSNGPITLVPQAATSNEVWVGSSVPIVDGGLARTFGGNRPIDIDVFTQYGRDPNRHPDLRDPDALQTSAWVFTADQDRTWYVSINGWILPNYAVPPDNANGPGIGPDRFRLWVQRLDLVEDDLIVEERFEYPAALTLEQGATIFRDFLVSNLDGSPATNVTARLVPTGSCSTLEPGWLRCQIESGELAPGAKEFGFGTARHNGNSESTSTWPGFGFNLVERDTVAKAQVTADASAKGEVVLFIEAGVESSLAIEYQHRRVDRTRERQRLRRRARRYGGRRGGGEARPDLASIQGGD